MVDVLTRVDKFGVWYAKREDLAGYTGDGAPSGDGLDPFYAAKAMGHVTPGSMLWVSGRRPGVRIVTGP